VKLLLDTHAFLWHADGSPQMSAAATALLNDPANDLYVSMATAWEIAIKVGLGKLGLSCAYADYMAKAITGYGINVLPITLEDCAHYSTMPFPVREHRDPFDRLIITHANRNDASVVGADANFDADDMTRLW
jgi:PIN domain nuclease of toxin-antitoxin system